MTLQSDRFDRLDGIVRAFERETATLSDGRATRARVLASAAGRLRRRALARKMALGVAIGLAAVMFGSVAWTAIGRWHASTQRTRAAVVELGQSLAPTARRSDLPSATESISATADQRSQDSEETRAYQRAHETHFGADNPPAALAAWTAYLRHYPTGTFAPEARFNRAICLLRLGRRREASEALRAFAADRFGDYRRKDARRLLGWIDDDPYVQATSSTRLRSHGR
jgi:TolA-binding protein